MYVEQGRNYVSKFAHWTWKLPHPDIENSSFSEEVISSYIYIQIPNNATMFGSEMNSGTNNECHRSFSGVDLVWQGFYLPGLGGSSCATRGGVRLCKVTIPGWSWKVIPPFNHVSAKGCKSVLISNENYHWCCLGDAFQSVGWIHC